MFTMAVFTVVGFYTVVLFVSLAASTPINSTNTCPENEFWDVGTDRCENCVSYCHDAAARRMTEICSKLCPIFFANGEAANEQSPAELNLKPNSDAAGHSVPVVNIAAPVATVLVAVVAAVVVVGAVVFYRQRRKDNRHVYKPAPVQDEGVPGQNKLLLGRSSISITNVNTTGEQRTPIYTKHSRTGHLQSAWV